MIKACWSDNTLLPGTCVIDDDERYNCIYAADIAEHTDCSHWNEVLALELAQEIVGGEYKIVRCDDGRTSVLGRLSDAQMQSVLDM